MSNDQASEADRYWSGECVPAEDYCVPDVSRFGEVEAGVAEMADVDPKGTVVPNVEAKI